MTVLWNGAKDHPGGRQLFADEWPTTVPQPRRVYVAGGSADTTSINMGRRTNPVCASDHCLRHVERSTDLYCRICEKRS